MFLMGEIMTRMMKGKAGREILTEIYRWICVYCTVVERTQEYKTVNCKTSKKRDQ